MHWVQTQSMAAGDSGSIFYPGRKLGEMEKAQLWNWLHEEPEKPSRMFQERLAQREEPLSVSVRQINRLRAEWGLNRKQGRPRRAQFSKPSIAAGKIVQVTPKLSFAGVHIFADWMEQQEKWDPLLNRLQPRIEVYQREHPQANFPLLHHREQTLRLRLQALCFAPLFGIKKLTEFDTAEHPLKTLLGRGYQSSTLTQFLAQMERIDAAQALMSALWPKKVGRIVYVDGHMIPYWARVSMHKGKITMLGRIMAGSQAVIAHDENGQALQVEYYPPDMHLSYIVKNYCGKLHEAKGMELFVMDREINSIAVACAFEAKQWGLLSMLDSNEYQGLSSFDADPIGELEDGSCVYEGRWKKGHKEDPRSFVLVEQANGRVLVYWGTSKVKGSLPMIEWPAVYRQRSEVQENSFKRMIDHGALNTNYGRKKILGPDRHHQRAQEKLEKSLQGAHEKVEKKKNQVKEHQEKVSESEQKGHGKRLEQRQRALIVQEEELKKSQQKEEKIGEQIEDLGVLGERADRDLRKQTIMTFRTLFMENALTSFIALLWANLPEKVSLESLLKIFFHRSGFRLETDSEVLYAINCSGLSLSCQRTLQAVVEGLGAMNLQCRGKPIRVCLREMPS